MIDNITEALRWLSVVFAAIAFYYTLRFIIRYRQVRWEAYPWGRHVMRLSRLIAATMLTAILVRLTALLGWTSPLLLAFVSASTFGWVAYEMRRRYFLEEETQREQRIKSAAVASENDHPEGDSQ